MLSKIIKYLTILCIICLVFVVYKSPINSIINLVSVPKNVTLYDPEGSLWNGSLKGIKVDNNKVDNISWNQNIFSILFGNGANISFDDRNLAKGTFKLSVLALPNDILIKDFVAKGFLSSILSYAKIKTTPFKIDGLVTTDIHEISINEDGELKYFKGTINIDDASLTSNLPGIQSVGLGEINVFGKGAQKLVTLSVDQKGKSFSFNGNIEISDMKKYQITGLITVSETTDVNLRNYLYIIGKKNEDGTIYVDYEGKL